MGVKIKKNVLSIILISIVIVLLSNNVIAIPNPSAVYCEEMGYTYRVDKASEGEKGTCVIKPEVEFKAWDFFRGKVGGKYSYCAKKGYDTETEHIHKETYSTEYAVCVSRKTFIDGIKPLFGITTQEVKIPMHELMKENGDSLDLKSCEIEEKQEQETDYKEALKIYQDNSRKVPADFYVTSTPPALFDWRNKDGQDWVTSVKSQGSCGSCWAFSAVGTVEAKLNIDNNNSNLDYDLSEQELVSCGNAGDCTGGWNYKSFNYIRDTGIADEDCFPYVASDVACDLCSNWKDRTFEITDYHKVTATQAALKQALLDYGPLSVPVESTGWSSYTGGIFNGSNSDMDHLVLLVGYNDTGGYWIIKNSWGEGWGENGYMRLSYTNNPITSFDVTYAVEQTILPIDRGELQPYLIYPVSSINVTKNKFFNFSTGVKCVDGYCGDVTATLTLPPSQITTCSEVWGFDCGTGPPETGGDNTFDSCSNGNGNDDSIDEIWLSSNVVSFGEEVGVICQYSSTTPSSGELYIYYRNSSSGTWQQKYSGTGTSGSPQNFSVKFFPDDVEGIHQLRCIGDYNGENDECAGGNWFDNDDINFSVHNHTSGKGKVPMDYGNPFYTINQNPVSCMNMTNKSTCNQTWAVNATGGINSRWLFYTIYSSNLPNVETNTTEKINLTIIEFTNNIITALIELSKGWNLVSLPLQPENFSVENVIKDLTGQIVVWYYNASSDGWTVYDTDSPFPWLNTLHVIDYGKAYWLKSTINQTLTVQGNIVKDYIIKLKTGWNFVGYNMSTSIMPDPINGLTTPIVVWAYYTAEDEWKVYDTEAPFPWLNTLTNMIPKKGYWLKSSIEQDWKI